MTKYVNYGNPKYGTHMFVITMFKTEHGNYKVGVLPCEHTGSPVSGPVFWDIFSSWFAAKHYMNQQYKEWFEVANWRY